MAFLVQIHPSTIVVQHIGYPESNQHEILIILAIPSSWLKKVCFSLSSGSNLMAQLVAKGFSSPQFGEISLDSSCSTKRDTSSTKCDNELTTNCYPGTACSNGSCELCAPGSFSNTSSSNRCELCPENQFAPLTGTSSCFFCPEGSESPRGASQCYWKKQESSPNNLLLFTVPPVLGGGIITLLVSVCMGRDICSRFRILGHSGSSWSNTDPRPMAWACHEGSLRLLNQPRILRLQ